MFAVRVIQFLAGAFLTPSNVQPAIRVISLLCISQVAAQIFLTEPGFEPVSVEFPDHLSPGCQTALNQSVECNSSLVDITFNGWFPTGDDLAYLCTEDCLISMNVFRSNQLSSCNATEVVTSEGISYPSTLSIDELLFTYNYTCRKDPETGEFCAPQIADWHNGTLTAQQNCSDCILGTYQSELNSYFGYDPDFAAEFSSLTSSCKKSGYLVTSPTRYLPISTETTSASATTSSATTCIDKYVIDSGDDCHSISKSHNVSTSSLLYENGLGARCIGFPEPGTQLCLPKPCDIYTVQVNESCYDIVRIHNYGFTVTQLVSWNPDINRGCSNLEQLAGFQICISMPGDSGGQTTHTPTQVPTPAPIPSDTKNGTNLNCAKYYHVVAGDTCGLVTIMNSISLQDFYFLNPEVNSTTCENLEAGSSYCVQAVGDIKTYSGYQGVTSVNPCLYGTSHPSSCYATTSIRTDTYWSWPTASTTMIPNITAPSALPTALGTNENCAGYQTYFEWQNSNRTSTSTDPNSCVYIAYFRGIEIEQLLEWNPSLSYNESNAGACVIERGYRYCISSNSDGATSPSPTSSSTTPKGPSTTQSPSTSRSDSIATPTPTQRGMAGGCTSFYLVRSGDSCYGIARDANIELSSFYTWNPAVKDDCSALWPDYYVCIGNSTSMTTSATSELTAGYRSSGTTNGDWGRNHASRDLRARFTDRDGCEI